MTDALIFLEILEDMPHEQRPDDDENACDKRPGALDEEGEPMKIEDSPEQRGCRCRRAAKNRSDYGSFMTSVELAKIISLKRLLKCLPNYVRHPEESQPREWTCNFFLSWY